MYRLKVGDKASRRGGNRTPKIKVAQAKEAHASHFPPIVPDRRDRSRWVRSNFNLICAARILGSGSLSSECGMPGHPQILRRYIG